MAPLLNWGYCILIILPTILSTIPQCPSGHNCCDLSIFSCNLRTFSNKTSTLIYPGGSTRCIKSTSSPYSFEVFRGSPKKVLFYFQGGGSCWNEETTLSSGVNGKQQFCSVDAEPWDPSYGYFDLSDPRNRYSEYTIIHVLYCSGDLHVGNAVRDYLDESGGQVVQSGIENVNSVLAWAQHQQVNGGLSSQLDDLVVMGCSAGSIAAQVWGNEISKLLNNPSRIAIVMDSYVGIFPGSSESKLIYDFGACTLSFLSEELRLKCLAQNGTLADMIEYGMSTAPYIPYSFIQSRYDSTQVNYYNYIADSSISPEFSSYNYTKINSNQFAAFVDTRFQNYNKFANFVVYFIDGSQHCYTPAPYIYTADTTGHIPKTAIGMSTESLLKWTGRLPLVPGEQIQTVCGANSVCASRFPNKYSQILWEQHVQYDIGSTRIVHQLNNVPRYDSNMNQVTVRFNETVDWFAYTESCVAFAAIIYAVGIILVFMLFLFLLARACVDFVMYVEAWPSSEHGLHMEVGRKEKIMEQALRYMSLMNQMYFFLFLAFVCNHLLFLGNSKISEGVTVGTTSLDILYNSFSVLKAEGQTLNNLGEQTGIYLNIASANCAEAGNIYNQMYLYQNDISSYIDSVDSTSDKINYFNGLVSVWAEERRSLMVWALYAFVNISLFMFFLSVKCSSKCLLNYSIGFSMFFIIITCAISATYMILLVIISDFCLQPTEFTLQLVPQGQVKDAAIYYLTCSGNSPSFNYVYDADYDIRYLNYYTQTLLETKCVGNAALARSISTMSSISDTHIPIVDDLASCVDYYNTWNTFVEDGMCKDIFGGLYIIWISQTLTIALLLVCTIIGIRLIPLLKRVTQDEFGLLDDADHVKNGTSCESTEIELTIQESHY